ncbi:MAG: glutaredoxin family protein [Deinococcales bacterium]
MSGDTTHAGAVTLYTSPGCPDCAAVRAWLEEHEVPFTERDVSRPDVADEAKRLYGVRVAPITVINRDTFFYGTFDQQRPRLTAVLLAPNG